MNKGALCASVLAFLLLLTLVPFSVQAVPNTDAYLVKEEFTDRAVQGEESASYDYLEVKVAFYVNASGAGSYNLTAGLEAEGREISSTSASGLYGQGSHSIPLRFRNRDIYNGRATGRYLVHLSLNTPNFPLAPVEVTYNTSQSYYYADFNPDKYAPYPPGSTYTYTDDQSTTTIKNTYLTFTFDKNNVTMRYFYTQDQPNGKNGRFSVSFVRVAGYIDRGFGFNRTLVSHEALLAGSPWSIGTLQNGTHRAYGPYMRFNITYMVPLKDSGTGATAATLNITFSFYFTGNPRPSVDRALTVAGSTQAEMYITLELSNPIGDSGLVLEQVLTDPTRSHDFLLRDAIGDFKYNETNARNKEQKLSPRLPDSIPKMSFVNKWDSITYGVYSWSTPAVSRFASSNGTLNADVTYIAEGKSLRLFLAYPARGAFVGFNHDMYFGLEGTQPPPPPPGIPEGERHDPLLYLLGSVLALAIIFLTMRLRSRSYVEEEEELEKIERMELAETEEGQAPLSIEEKVEGEEDEWRRKFEERKRAEEAAALKAQEPGEPPEVPPEEGPPPRGKPRRKGMKKKARGPEGGDAK